MNLDKEVIETVLKNEEYSNAVQRVVSMEYESALPKGENYLSTIYRISLKVVLGNGRLAKKSLIYKVVPPEKGKVALVNDLGVFKCETLMYSTVLREMEMLMEEFGDTNDPLWCRLVHYEPYTSLLFEDLKASGFQMKRRQDCLDLDHSLLALRSLGRFHAMAKVLEQRGIINKDDYKPYPLVNDRNLIKTFVYYGLQTIAKAMEDDWGPEWYDVAQKLKIPCEILEEKMLELGKLDETRFNCLNHGDCWSNNMLFKYDWQNKPYTMRFIDYQVLHYNSVGYDLDRILFTAVNPSVRKVHFDTLLSAYHSSLEESLKLFKYEGDIPSLEWLHLELKRLGFISYGEAPWKFIMCSENPEAWNLDLFMQTGGTEGIDMAIYRDEYLRSITEEDIKVFVNEYVPIVMEEYKSLLTTNAS